jgi:hypothetical protein
VEKAPDWVDMAARYDAEDPARIPTDASKIGERLRNREGIVLANFSGPFWQLREWLGLENLCMLFYDDPRFLREMVRFWEDFVAVLLERIFTHTTLDEVHISEDMAYKSFQIGE